MIVTGGPLDGLDLKRVAGIAFYMIVPQENNVYRYIKKDGAWKFDSRTSPIPKYFVKLNDIEIGLAINRARDELKP